MEGEQIIQIGFLLIPATIVLNLIVIWLMLTMRKQIKNLCFQTELSLNPPQQQYEIPELEKLQVVQPTPQINPVPMQPIPKPQTKKIECKKCGKDFSDEKKLKRHIGMAHYQDLEI